MRFDSDMSLLISASIIKKSSGPKTVPCGTPLSTGESPLIAPEILVCQEECHGRLCQMPSRSQGTPCLLSHHPQACA